MKTHPELRTQLRAQTACPITNLLLIRCFCFVRGWVTAMEPPVQLKVIEDRGDIGGLRNFLRFVLVHNPDVVALEMLPNGEFKEETAETVTQFYGTQYVEAARNMVKDGYTVVGLEQQKHRPFMQTIGGTWKNAVLRLQGGIEQDWLDSLAEFRGKKVVIFCRSIHAHNLKCILNL